MRVVLAGSALVGIVVAAQIGVAQSKPPSIEGVWKGVSIVTNDPNGGPGVPSRQANIFIYTKRYFSQVRQDGSGRPEPERSVLPPPKDPNNLTVAEKLARYENWRAVAAAAGPYEVKGTTLYQYDLVGKNQSPGAIELNKSGKTAQFAATAELRFEGNDTMVQIQKSADGKYEIRRTFTRLESAAEVEARPPAAPSIAGVWMSTSYVATGANPVSNPKRLPNIVIYTKEYFSSVTQDSDTRPTLPPRPVLAPPKDVKLTDAEKLARYEHWVLLGAAAGRYEVKGTTFYQYPLVSKNHTAAIISRNQTGELGIIAPNSEIKFEGNDTMLQIATSPDGKTVTRRTYKRFE